MDTPFWYCSQGKAYFDWLQCNARYFSLPFIQKRLDDKKPLSPAQRDPRPKGRRKVLKSEGAHSGPGFKILFNKSYFRLMALTRQFLNDCIHVSYESDPHCSSAPEMILESAREPSRSTRVFLVVNSLIL